MLFEALLLSAVVLAVVSIGFCSRRGAVWVAGGCLAFFLPGMFCFPTIGMPFWLRPRPVLMLQTGLLVWLAYWGTRRAWRVRSFVGLSVLATLGAYSLMLLEAGCIHLGYERFRREYPFESLEGRLPVPAVSPGDGALPAATRRNLAEQEQALQQKGPGFLPRMLYQIHNEHWDTFINSPGFGALRRFRPTEDQLRPDPFPEPPVAQPGPPFPPPRSPGNPQVRVSEAEEDSLLGLHRGSLLDFSNPYGFGFVKSRREVAGFQPHGFHSVPKGEGWEVRRVDLVGLLLHEQPVVYLTDGLPRMDGAGRASTRAPDAFESAGLQALAQGEDLYAVEVPQGLRMLGALRSIDQCVRCHGGRRGDLLGAFSYCLTKVGQPSP